uniref:(northern house mosquito) hypothetical protein n=2 Tax=Culex pipiens TaxID=7175 RepID=A0A8D8IKK5_CULPI
MKQNLILVACLVAAFVTCPASAKPSGYGSYEEVTERCCNDCIPCRESFAIQRPADTECARSKNYAFDVQHVRSAAWQEENYETLNAGVEAPQQAACPKLYNKLFHVEKPRSNAACEAGQEALDFQVAVPSVQEKCKKLNLKARIDHQARQCDCVDCMYVSYGNSSSLSNKSCPKRHKRMKRSRLKQAIGRQFREELDLDDEPEVTSLFRNSLKRSSSVDGVVQKDGYFCRCVPESNKDLLINCKPGSLNDPIVGAPLSDDLHDEEDEVYIGGRQPPSYKRIRDQLDRITDSRGGQPTSEVVADLMKIYYDVYKNSGQRNYSVPFKYGAKTVHVDSSGLRTYDIEPVEGLYEPSMWNRLASMTNKMFGEYVDQRLNRPKVGGRMRLLNPVRRFQNNGFMNLMDSYNEDRKRQCKARRKTDE